MWVDLAKVGGLSEVDRLAQTGLIRPVCSDGQTFAEMARQSQMVDSAKKGLLLGHVSSRW